MIAIVWALIGLWTVMGLYVWLTRGDQSAIKRAGGAKARQVSNVSGSKPPAPPSP